jgi:hypothetical protein
MLHAAKLDPVLMVDRRDPNPYDEFKTIRKNFTDVVGKRQLAVSYGQKVCFIDDDIRFYKRSPDNRALNPTPKDVARMFKEADKLLDTYALVGVHGRGFINAAPRGYTVNKGHPPIQVMFFNPKLFKRTLPKSPFTTCDDLWMGLNLIKQGLPFATMTEWCYGARANTSHFNDAVKLEHYKAMLKMLVPEEFLYNDGANMRYSPFAKAMTGV